MPKRIRKVKRCKRCKSFGGYLCQKCRDKDKQIDKILSDGIKKLRQKYGDRKVRNKTKKEEE